MWGKVKLFMRRMTDSWKRSGQENKTDTKRDTSWEGVVNRGKM